MLAMNGLGLLSAVVTYSSPSDASDAIWGSISGFEKLAGGLNETDHQKLAAFMNNAYGDGYVVARYDDPSQVAKPSSGQITAEVNRLNNGVYAPDEIGKAATNLVYLMGKGFSFQKGSAAPPAGAAYAPSRSTYQNQYTSPGFSVYLPGSQGSVGKTIGIALVVGILAGLSVLLVRKAS